MIAKFKSLIIERVKIIFKNELKKTKLAIFRKRYCEKNWGVIKW